MSIILPGKLPATGDLQAEKIPVEIAEEIDISASDILTIGFLNLMPEKLATELQVARMVANSNHRVRLVPFVTDTYMARINDADYRSANTPVDHLRTFYRSFSDIRSLALDGLIITGAPVETLPYEQVPYWAEMVEIFDWAKADLPGVFNICWGAMAALYHYYGVEKDVFDEKVFGIFPHQIDTSSPMTNGMSAVTNVPVSRYAGIRSSTVPENGPLTVLGTSDEAGLCLLEDASIGQVFMFNHLEYGAETLATEYERDQAADKAIVKPKYYFVDDRPGCLPDPHWHGNGYRLYENWLNDIARRKNG